MLMLNKIKKKNETYGKKRETKLFLSHSRISVSPIFGHWHIFITDCMRLCYLCVLFTHNWVFSSVGNNGIGTVDFELF